MKRIILTSLISVVVLSASQIDNNNFYAYKIGYNLPPALSISPEDMNDNVSQCDKLFDDSQLYFCIVGDAVRSSNQKMGDMHSMYGRKTAKMDLFINDRINYNKKFNILEKEKQEAESKRLANEKIKKKELKRLKELKERKNYLFSYGESNLNIKSTTESSTYKYDKTYINYKLLFLTDGFSSEKRSGIEYISDINFKQISWYHQSISKSTSQLMPYFAYAAGYIYDYGNLDSVSGFQVKIQPGMIYKINKSFEIDIGYSFSSSVIEGTYNYTNYDYTGSTDVEITQFKHGLNYSINFKF